ncbi:MAG: aldo/keto reductase [Gammaproteobacteria bacterium]
MNTRPLGNTALEIAPLVLGGNVFGWTADARVSAQVLDRFVDGGLNAIDTAEMYSAWVPGHQGGESESVIGDWLAGRPGLRERLVLITKVGADLGAGRSGLSARRIVEACEGSLKRLRVETIDLYFSHFPDSETPIEETLRAHESLIASGKVRAIGASNYSAEQLREALAVSGAAGLPRYAVVQPEYNLVTRDRFEGPLRDLCVAEGLGVITYYALAAGFLSGKYRSPADFSKSARGGSMQKYLDNPRAMQLLTALDTVAARRDATPAEVALAWLMGRDGVTAPIASATSVEQVDSLIRSTQLELTAEDLAELE